MPFVLVCALHYGGYFIEDRTEYYITRSAVRCEELARLKDADSHKATAFIPESLMQLQILCGPNLEDCKKDTL